MVYDVWQDRDLQWSQDEKLSLQSVMNRKGQGRSPRPFGTRLGVKAGGKVYFVIRGEEVVLKVIRGTILDLKGSVQPSAHPEDFGKIRQAVKHAMAKKVAGHG